MDTKLIEQVFQIDFVVFFTCLIVLASALVAIVKLIEQVSIIIKKPVSWVKKKNKDHEMLLKAIESISNLKIEHENDIKTMTENQMRYREQSLRIQDKFNEAIDKIDNKLDVMWKENIEKEINDMRWEIINTADKISNGRSIGKETYRHALRTYDKYEKIIEENNLTNSEVDLSIEIIRESYKDKEFLENEKYKEQILRP